MSERHEDDDDGVVDRLYEVLDEACEALSYEEREAVADALRAGAEDGPPASPRAGQFFARIKDRLREVEDEKGPGAPWFPWIQLAWEYLIEPTHGKRPDEMSPDELEHEIERYRKYHPRKDDE